jgi:glycosidase
MHPKTLARLVVCTAAFLPLFFMTNVEGKTPSNTQAGQYANPTDQQLGDTFLTREKDWRNGAIVYQVMVDRFAPSTRVEQKKHLYPAPKILRDWGEVPARGVLIPSLKLWSHEIDFWGGDLESLRGKVNYIQALGADVLYLCPIHLAYTNHKYDALDYLKISPEFGTQQDLKKLTDDVHKSGMKIVLDGVFNHMGRNADIFKQASSDPKSAYRDWFYFDSHYPGGARIWSDAGNLPELNLENIRVREYIYGSPDSVVRRYLRQGIDGWRLDVAYDLGFAYLGELTKAAHKQKPGSLVVGEIASYPKEWFPSVDGVMNFTARAIILQAALGEIEPNTAAQMISRVIEEAGIEPMLKSWLMLDNHDNFRLATKLPLVSQQRLAQALQFTLPGSPNLYYGTELGMTGGDDPEMRAPMRWDLVSENNAALYWTKKLVRLHKENRALRIGNFRPVSTNKLFAFERYTDRVEDTVVILANPTKSEITETILIANSKLMNGSFMINLLDKNEKPIRVMASMMTVTVPAGTVLILKPDVKPVAGYTPYKRVQ